MADNAVVHIGENSPEHVAHKLVLEIAAVEGKVLHRSPGATSTTADRKWILDTYAECLHAVKGFRELDQLLGQEVKRPPTQKKKAA